ncbi:radical SAM protein [Fusobacterium sp. SB021]|uniref:radical SAM protein n=1 Tax=Fusobacterium sp. SB021 TaxID=2744227 RepID=UPI003CE93C4D
MTVYEYDYPLYRPPSEAYSLIIQATLGCSQNKCTFCSMYKSKKFTIKPLEQIKKEIDFFRIYVKKAERIFLADGDALIMPMKILKEIFIYINEKFPEAERISLYGSPKSILLKTPEELLELKNLGLGLIYLGVESGSDKILSSVKKGVSREEIIAAGKKVKKVGIPLSVTAVAGLGGKENSIEHAVETASLISEINPDYFGVLTLMLEEGTELLEEYKKGNFIPLSSYEILEETKLMIKNINVKEKCIFRSNHASNYVSLKGTLPYEKENILKTIDSALENNEIKSEFLRRL